MKLKAYLAIDGNSATKLALACCVSVSTISRASAGHVMPNRDLMGRIYEATSGAVTPNDFFDMVTPPHCPLCDTSTPGEIAACTCVDCPNRQKEAA